MLKYDCKFLEGYRPCYLNKQQGIICNNCNKYESIVHKIIVIKLDAIGDVLRTTSILKPLKRKYPDSIITWLTRENAKELFNNNSLVDEVLTLDHDNFFRLSVEYFDVVINLDNNKVSSSIASAIKAGERIGFVLDKKGFILQTNSAADYWLHLSAFDNLKKENTKTYQEIIYSILELNLPIERPVLILNKFNDLNQTELRGLIKTDLKTIGLNVGVGKKWPTKGWPLAKWEELIIRLNDMNLNILLLVGPDEKELNEYFMSKYSFLISSGTSNSLFKFAEIVNICDLVVSCDSLALHICTALNKKIIALFGPTSSNEIELYNNGIKIKSFDECKCFYNRICTEKISCMEKISVNEVFNAIIQSLDNVLQ